MTIRFTPALAGAVLALGAAPLAGAQTFDIDLHAVANCDQVGDNGIPVALDAGTYIMRPVQRTYTSWNAWGSVSGCDAQGENCATGWLLYWNVVSESGARRFFPPTFRIWATPEQALANTGRGVLVLDKAQTVSFCILDIPCWDNLGGASLVVTSCRAEFNLDGVVNSTDVSDFINQWFQDQVDGTLLTDRDDNGVVNSTDVSDYINDWFADLAAGCGA